jgi:hypothetical protein
VVAGIGLGARVGRNVWPVEKLLINLYVIAHHPFNCEPAFERSNLSATPCGATNSASVTESPVANSVTSCPSATKPSVE